VLAKMPPVALETCAWRQIGCDPGEMMEKIMGNGWENRKKHLGTWLK